MSTNITRKIVAGVALAVAMLCGARVAAASDILDWFKIYYRQEIASGTYQGPLNFLHDAAAAHDSPEQVIKPRQSRSVTLDRRNGYLQIDDGAGTDQILTMAVYRRADNSPLVVVGSSNCADACNFSVQFFNATGKQLQALAPETVVPVIEPGQFIKPGHPIPKKLASIQPTVNYIPARVGTTLTLTPWYGYETEEQMDKATRALIRNVVLTWDGKQGRFVKAGGS